MAGKDVDWAGVGAGATPTASTMSRSPGHDTASHPPPTARPTWRWVFQLLEGMHRVRVLVPGQQFPEVDDPQ
jgi:hypothetical protein